MKAALNASVRDAQIRDSFNKKSIATVADKYAVVFCDLLYKLQSEMPRNASKLHSLVVINKEDNSYFLLNFEVLRSINLDVDMDMKGFANDDFLKKLLAKTKVKENTEDSDKSHTDDVEGTSESDEEGDDK